MDQLVARNRVVTRERFGLRGVAALPYEVRVQIAIHDRFLCSRTRCCPICRANGVTR